jgi:F-type H+-transporting ATPase subunit gamma
MASSRTIKKRIRSTKSIEQMTKAMEAVSAVKMRKSEMLALRARPYALAALEVLKNVRKGLQEEHLNLSPLLDERPVKKSCLVVFTSDKGLAGSFNTSVIRKTQEILKDNSKEYSLIVVGKKGKNFFARRNLEIAAEFFGNGDFGAAEDIKPLSLFITNFFTDKKCDEIILIYTNFLSALKQEIIVRKLLPFTEESLEAIVGGIVPERGKYANMPQALGTGIGKNAEYLFEASPSEVLSKLLPDLIEVEIYHSTLEANASEHSSRMVAMRSASDNAGDLRKELTLLYNKARQAQITKELAEISAGAEALQS